MAIQFIVNLLNSVFDTKCLYKGSGEMKRGPGFICGLYIILIISGLIYNIAVPQENIDKHRNLFLK